MVSAQLTPRLRSLDFNLCVCVCVYVLVLTGEHISSFLGQYQLGTGVVEQSCSNLHAMLPNNQVRVSSSRVVSQMVTSDITDKFTKAASSKKRMTLAFLILVYLFTDKIAELNTGQLVKDEYFTLFEAVGALEVCIARLRLVCPLTRG